MQKAENTEYLRYRESLTGLLGRDFAVRRYEDFKKTDGYCCVYVKICNCDNLPFYKAVSYIKFTGEILSRIYCGEIFSLNEGDFLAFEKDAESLCDKIGFFLKEFEEDDRLYVAVYDMLDANESFEVFYSRIKRHAVAEEIGSLMNWGKLAKNT